MRLAGAMLAAQEHCDSPISARIRDPLEIAGKHCPKRSDRPGLERRSGGPDTSRVRSGRVGGEWVMACGSGGHWWLPSSKQPVVQNLPGEFYNLLPVQAQPVISRVQGSVIFVKRDREREKPICGA